MHDSKELDHLLSLIADKKIDSVIKMPASGGNRKYYRIILKDSTSLIGVIADDLHEARSFVGLSQLFRKHGIAVPRILAYSDSYQYYIEEDLGYQSLYDRIINNEYSDDLIGEVMRQLAKMQCVKETEWAQLVTHKPFCTRQVMWDLNYFKYEYLKPCGIVFNEDALEDDFESLALRLTGVPKDCWGFQMRDCQSRNVMLSPEPVFIDYQSGRYGPGVYDAVSFLWQAKAGFEDSFRSEMLDIYASEFAVIRAIDKRKILSYADIFALFRTLQVLGAYGFRGLIEKRAHFIESIPYALRNLNDLIRRGILKDYAELEKVCSAICSDVRFVPVVNDGKLAVKIFSFSYKKGYPEDLSGNGGGFMFDCRGMHNPGRYDRFKPLTGRDKPVIDFLSERGEADNFVENAFKLVASSIETYLRRGFSSLQIGFGCTGGRHRSVYCAEKMARLIKQTFPQSEVILNHREQDIYEKL